MALFNENGLFNIEEYNGGGYYDPPRLTNAFGVLYSKLIELEPTVPTLIRSNLRVSWDKAHQEFKLFAKPFDQQNIDVNYVLNEVSYTYTSTASYREFLTGNGIPEEIRVYKKDYETFANYLNAFIGGIRKKEPGENDAQIFVTLQAMHPEAGEYILRGDGYVSAGDAYEIDVTTFACDLDGENSGGYAGPAIPSAAALCTDHDYTVRLIVLEDPTAERIDLGFRGGNLNVTPSDLSNR